MKIGNKDFDFNKRTYIMGILNVTPDSFSDGGKFHRIDRALEHADQMIAEGADIIDVGGESTRPDHIQISPEEEINRVVPIIKELKKHCKVPISIDTYKSRVAKEALDAGADLVNDIWGLKYDREMAKVISNYQVPVCLMHNRKNKEYSNFISDVLLDFENSIKIAKEAGIKDENIIIDPGLGFAKSLEENLILMNHIKELKIFGYPILLGASRKSMIGLTLNEPIQNRLEGTLATSVIGVMKGCNIIRVHDVLANSRAIRMTEAIIKA